MNRVFCIIVLYCIREVITMLINIDIVQFIILYLFKNKT